MISFKKRKKLKRKLFLPIILIFVLLAGLLVYNLKDFHFQIDWSVLFPSSTLVKPIPEKNLEVEIKESFLPLRRDLEGLDLSNEEKVVATFSGNLTVVFSREKNWDFQVTSLQFILWRAKIEGKRPYFVDLRFDKPIVKI